MCHDTTALSKEDRKSNRVHSHEIWHWRTFSIYQRLYGYKKTDRETAQRYKVKYAIDKPGIKPEKYLDEEFWILENLFRAYQLCLHEGKSQKSILDIGTGTGYFPFICKYYGHRAEAVDLPNNEMYNEIIRALEIDRFDDKVEWSKSLLTPRKYDLITAFMICFNNHRRQDLWHIREWATFLNNLLENNLKTEGEVFLSLNKEPTETPVDPELLAFFSKNGAKVDGKRIWLKGGTYLRENVCAQRQRRITLRQSDAERQDQLQA